jgi:NAD(P)H-dependent FMN reductase
MCQTWAATPLRVAVIIGSTRESRLGDTVARWFTAQARRRDDIELNVIDLLDFAFPARYPDRATPQMTRFTAAIGAADAFVVVTPEYNRSFPASLKQAIDYAYDEWQAKPVGFVSYGWCSAGLYAVEQLRTVFTELHAVTMRDGVAVNLLDGGFDDSGGPAVADRHEQAVATMLAQLLWWGRALRDARTAHPYVS